MQKIYCVNCKNFGHSASYKGCPKLAELRKKLNEKIIKAKTTETERIAQISRKYVPELKFADVVKQGTSISRARENPPQLINIAPRVNQNPNPIVNIPQLNIINVIEDVKKSILKALSEQQTQLNEIKKIIKNAWRKKRLHLHRLSIDNIDDE